MKEMDAEQAELIAAAREALVQLWALYPEANCAATTFKLEAALKPFEVSVERPGWITGERILAP